MNSEKFGLLKPFLSPQKGRLTIACVLFALSGLLDLVPYLLVYAAALEIFAPEPSVSALLWLSLWAALFVLPRILLYGGGLLLSHIAAFSVVRQLRQTLAEKLLRVPGGFFAEHEAGDLKKLLVDDAGGLESLIAHNLPEVASAVVVPLASVLLLLFVDWRLALAGVAMVPVAFFLQSRLMSDADQRMAAWHEAESKANHAILEFIQGVVVLKAFGRDGSSLEGVRQGVYGIRDLAVEMTEQQMKAFAVFFSLLSNNLLVVLPVGLFLYLSAGISQGELVLFIALGAGMLSPLMALMFMFGQLQRASAAIDRIGLVLKAADLPEPEAASEPADASVRFDKLSFSYPGREEAALSELSFELSPGTVTALVGTSGAGKTSLVRLLVRQYDPQEGSITIGGVDLKALSTDARRRWISHVRQETTLFDASVADNLRLGKPEASEAELKAAAQAACAAEFIEALPEGYDTQLGDGGGQLSGGERQRLSIAREILKDAPIVLLDEVTANVDPQSEQGIQAGLSALAADKTVLVVAHRLKTIAAADQILVLDQGKLVDRGDHEGLLARCEVYARLWADQGQAERWTIGATA